MYPAPSHKIKVTVRPKFLAEQSEPEESRYFWSYTIEIANDGDRTVQLTHRHWKITDANGRREEVQGPGVVGEQPTLKPGAAFEVASPAFSLDSPYAKRVLN